MKRRFLCATVLMLCFVPISVNAAVAEKRFYSKTVGSGTTQVEWKLEKRNHLILTWSEDDETVVTRHDSSWATVKCFVSRPAEQTFVTAEREGNLLRITGNLKGKTVEKKIPIDHLPWYQALSLSLRPFVLSNHDSLYCWTLRLDTLRVYKIQASKASTDLLTYGGRPVNVQKVKLRLTGILAFIGESHYWFRMDDGVFMKYVGPATLKSRHQIIIELTKNKYNPNSKLILTA